MQLRPRTLSLTLRRLLLVSAAALGATLTGACGSEDGEDTVRISVIPKGTTHEFWKSIHAGAKVAAQELGVEITWSGPLREDDRESQIQVVENSVIGGADGIVIAPLDDTALARPLEEAAAEGIPVIVVDSDVDWDGRVSFVATDNYKGGQIAARALGDLLGGEGQVMMMRYLEGSASTEKREAGFLDTLRKDYPGIEVVSDNQYAGATNEGAYQTSENLLIQFGDVVEGIFCPNESAAFGMLRALEDAGLAGDKRFVGFDASEKLVEALREGTIDGLILQDPWAMGDLGVRKLVAHLNGEPVEPRIDTGVHLVTKENMDEPEMSRLLVPDLSVLGD